NRSATWLPPARRTWWWWARWAWRWPGRGWPWRWCWLSASAARWRSGWCGGAYSGAARQPPRPRPEPRECGGAHETALPCPPICLPAPGNRGTVEPMGTSTDTPRAEFPPARYWRRWCADAEPPRPVLVGVEAVEDHAVPASVPGPAAVAARSGEDPYRVLIVEDDRSQALFATSVLAGAGIQAEAIADPDQVMARLEAIRPDLVLMDLHMPAIDGAELTNMIRSHAELSHTPIVFLTGDPDPERQFEVLEIGADDFLTKPVRPRHLIAAVENRIMRARQQHAQRVADKAGTGTGLHTRSRMFQRLATAIPNDTGALHVVELAGIPVLREKLG